MSEQQIRCTPRPLFRSRYGHRHTVLSQTNVFADVNLCIPPLSSLISVRQYRRRIQIKASVRAYREMTANNFGRSTLQGSNYVCMLC